MTIIFSTHKVPWQQLRHVFLRHLPHSWTWRDDTTAALESAKKWTEDARGRPAEANAASIVKRNLKPHLSEWLDYGEVQREKAKGRRVGGGASESRSSGRRS